VSPPTARPLIDSLVEERPATVDCKNISGVAAVLANDLARVTGPTDAGRAVTRWRGALGGSERRKARRFDRARRDRVQRRVATRETRRQPGTLLLFQGVEAVKPMTFPLFVAIASAMWGCGGCDHSGGVDIVLSYYLMECSHGVPGGGPQGCPTGAAALQCARKLDAGIWSVEFFKTTMIDSRLVCEYHATQEQCGGS
jgi:hypothetical protein